MIGRTISHYRILEKLGAGGMGVVYRAEDTNLNRQVAIKVLPEMFSGDSERMARFEREAKLLASLNHPNIAAIHGLEKADGERLLVLELVGGDTLAQRIAKGPLPVDEALEVCRQIAEGLEAAHEKGIIHRDLKPSNVKVTPEGKVKVLDFGLAKALQDRAASADSPTISEMTRPGVLLGTAAYMSPEQARAKPVDKRADIWAFGCILYECLTGKRVFEGETITETLAAILKGEPDWKLLPNDVRAKVRDVLQRCLQKDPKLRYHDIADARLDIEAPATHPSETITASRRPSLLWLAPFTAVMLLAGILIYLLGSRAAAYRAPVYTQITFRRGFLQNARFAPDGEMVLHSGEWQGSPNELFQGRFDSPFSRPMGLADATIAAVSSTGELAVIMGCHRFFFWFCGGTLARVPLSGGFPRPIAENTAYADWSPDGKDLVAVRYGSGEYRLEYPIGKVLYRTRGWLASPRFSPRGDRIAFIEHPTYLDDGWVSVTDPQGNVKVLSTGWYSIQGLAWSPAGDEVWFAAGKSGVSEPDSLHAATLSGRVRTVASYPGTVRLHDISAKGRVLLSKESWRGELYGFFPGSDRERDLSWLDWSTPSDLSPDGTQVLISGGAPGGVELCSYLRKTDGSPAVLLGEGGSPRFSPDLKWVAVVTPTIPPSLNLLPTGAGESRTLERGSIEEYLSWRWHPDGKQILFVGRRKGEGPRLFRQNVAGGPPVPALPAPFTPHGLCLSPDGRFVVARGADGKLYRAPLDGGAAVPLPGLTADDTPLLWSADGRSLYVSRIGGGSAGLPARVHRVAVGSGEKQLWKEIAPSDCTGVFNILSIVISRDERSYAYTFGRVLSELFVADGLK